MSSSGKNFFSFDGLLGAGGLSRLVVCCIYSNVNQGALFGWRRIQRKADDTDAYEA